MPARARWTPPHRQSAGRLRDSCWRAGETAPARPRPAAGHAVSPSAQSPRRRSRSARAANPLVRADPAIGEEPVIDMQVHQPHAGGSRSTRSPTAAGSGSCSTVSGETEFRCGAGDLPGHPGDAVVGGTARCERYRRGPHRPPPTTGRCDRRAVMPGRAFPWSRGAARTRRPRPTGCRGTSATASGGSPARLTSRSPTRHLRSDVGPAGRRGRPQRCPIGADTRAEQVRPGSAASAGRPSARWSRRESSTSTLFPGWLMVNMSPGSGWSNTSEMPTIAVPHLARGGAPRTTLPPPPGRRPDRPRRRTDPCRRGPRPGSAGRDRAPPADPWTGRGGRGRSPETGAARPSGPPASGRRSAPGRIIAATCRVPSGRSR